MTPAALRQYQRYLLYTLVALLPLVITPGGRDIFRLGKEVFAQMIAFALVSLAGIEVIQEKRSAFVSKMILLPMAAFCVWSAVSVFWAAVRPLALYALFNLLLFCLFLLALARLLEPRHLRFVILLNLLPASITSIYTAIQYWGLDPLLLTPQGTVLSGRENAGGLVGDVNSAGCYLALSLMLSANSIFLERFLIRKAWALIGCGVVLGGLLFTQTLTAIAAAAAAAVIWMALNSYLYVYHSGEKRKLWIVMLCLFLLAGGTGAVFTLKNPNFRQRLLTRYQNFRAGDWARLTSYRAPIFAVTWHMAMESPLMGHGLQSFETDFYAAKLRHRPGQRISMPGSIESTPRQSHNEYLQVFAELGVVGLTTLLIFIGGLLHLGFLGFLSSSRFEDRQLMISFLSALVTILVASVGFFPAHLALTAVWIAMVGSAITTLAHDAVPRVRERGSQLPSLPHSGVSSSVSRKTRPLKASAIPWPLFLFAISIPLLAGYALLSPLLANERIGRATTLIERVLHGGVPDARVYLEQSLNLLEQARREDPLAPQLYQSAGTAYWYLYQFEAALENFSLAALLDPTPEGFTNLGEAYRALGKVEIAEKSFAKALAYNPEFEKAKNAKEFLEKLTGEKASRRSTVVP
ncbi:MAG: O-antigen ligase family protein [Acidobacteria bacterium]|nr:O-antigen ligase family protein [Acidobacteriota bacterium]